MITSENNYFKGGYKSIKLIRYENKYIIYNKFKYFKIAYKLKSIFWKCCQMLKILQIK